MNIAFFSGRLTGDPETKYTKQGTPVSNFTLAVDSGFGDYKRTDFPRFNLWKRENLVKFLTKGKAITVTAEYQERKYQDRDGNNRKAIEFVVRDLEFQQGDPKGGGQSKQTQQAQSQPQQSASLPGPDQGWEHDDVPF
jgi:single-strand DNA-binding protein